jgi:hypothetical protein
MPTFQSLRTFSPQLKHEHLGGVSNVVVLISSTHKNTTKVIVILTKVAKKLNF